MCVVNTLTQLKITLEILRANGLSRIKTAFDMDFSTNQHVQNGFNSLLSLLDEWASDTVRIFGMRVIRALTITSGKE